MYMHREDIYVKPVLSLQKILPLRNVVLIQNISYQGSRHSWIRALCIVVITSQFVCVFVWVFVVYLVDHLRDSTN